MRLSCRVGRCALSDVMFNVNVELLNSLRSSMNFSTFPVFQPLTLNTPKRTHIVGFFLSRTACRRDTYLTSPTRTKLAENLWNTFERLRATWISVEPHSVLVTRHDPSTFPKIGIDSKNATNFWICSKSLKKFEVEKISLRDLLRYR